jgi:hypothetical protein
MSKSVGRVVYNAECIRVGERQKTHGRRTRQSDSLYGRLV